MVWTYFFLQQSTTVIDMTLDLLVCFTDNLGLKCLILICWWWLKVGIFRLRSGRQSEWTMNSLVVTKYDAQSVVYTSYCKYWWCHCTNRSNNSWILLGIYYLSCWWLLLVICIILFDYYFIIIRPMKDGAGNYPITLPLHTALLGPTPDTDGFRFRRIH